MRGCAVPAFLMERPAVTEQDLSGKSQEEQDLLKLMGFASFDSSKVCLSLLFVSLFHRLTNFLRLL
jgi:hypothetical protein